MCNICTYILALKRYKLLLRSNPELHINGFISLGLNTKILKKRFDKGHERPDVVENREKFLNTMKDLEPYLVTFEKDRLMKTKKYLDNCAIGRDVRCLVIVITHHECMFSANDRIRKV